MSLGFKRLIYPEPLGPPRPVAGDLYLTFCFTHQYYISKPISRIYCTKFHSKFTRYEIQLSVIHVYAL